MTAPEQFQAGPNDAEVRVDRLLRKLLKDVPLSHIYRMLRTGKVRVNGKRVKSNYRVQPGDEIALPRREGREGRQGREDRSAAAGTPGAVDREDLDIVHEDEHILVVNKPAGMVTHGSDSLEDRVRAYLQRVLPKDLGFRPGPLHRLDRNSSGAIAFSRSIHGARAFSSLLRKNAVRKVYLSVLSGPLVETQRWDFPLRRHGEGTGSYHDEEGKPARTWVFPVKSVELTGEKGAPYPPGRYSLAVFRISTGRTHQIRVHAATAGHPLVGDTRYGGPRAAGGMLLHAWLLSYADPEGPLGERRLEAPLPPAALERIRAAFGGEAIAAARDAAWRALD